MLEPTGCFSKNMRAVGTAQVMFRVANSYKTSPIKNWGRKVRYKVIERQRIWIIEKLKEIPPDYALFPLELDV